MLVQGSVKYTCDRGDTLGGFTILTTEFTRTCLSDGSFSGRPCVSPQTLRCAILFFPLVQMLPWCTARLRGTFVCEALPQTRKTCQRQLLSYRARRMVSSPSAHEMCSLVVCNELESQGATVSVGCSEVADHPERKSRPFCRRSHEFASMMDTVPCTHLFLRNMSKATSKRALCFSPHALGR